MSKARATVKYGSDTNWNELDFQIKESDLLYHCDSPWIKRYHM
jgi:hypothetical protein